MEHHHTLDARLLLTSNKDIQEAINKKSVTISTLSLALGLGILCSGSLIEDKSSGLYLAVISAPFFLLIIALFHLIHKRKKLVYAPTGSPITEGYLHFEKSQLEVMKTMLQSDSAENIEWTGFARNGNARLHYMVSEDARFAAVQLYEYIPYNFEVASEVYTYCDHHVHPIAQLLLQHHPNR